MTQSYSNFLGTGDRRQHIKVTTNFTNDASYGNTRLADTTIQSNSGGWFMGVGEDPTGKWIRWDFLCAPRIIDKIKVYAQFASSGETYKFQGLSAGGTWTDLGSTFTIDTVEINLSNSTAYYSYRMLGVSGSSQNPNLNFEFSIDDTVSSGFVHAEIDGNASLSATTWTTSAITTSADAWLVAIFFGEHPSTAFGISSITDSDGLTWTKRTQFQNTTTNAHCDHEIWYARRTTPSSGTVTFNFSGTVDDGAYTVLAINNLPDMSSLWKSGFTTATYHNDTATAATPAISLTHSGRGLALLSGGSPRNNQPSHDEGYGEGQHVSVSTQSGGSQWCWTNVGAFLTLDPSSYAVQWRGTVHDYSVIADIIDLGGSSGGGGSGVWASVETKDTFAAAGSAVTTGTLAATDAKDGFAAVGYLPPEGTLSVTEHGDSWATSSGFDTFGFEDVSTSVGGSTFGVTTLGPDRVIVLIYASIGSSNRFNNVVSIDGPLTWHSEAIGSGILPGGGLADGVSLQILYAHAHDKLTSETFNITADGGAINIGTLHCAIKGLNGNYNNPWSPADIAPCIGADGFTDTNTAKVPSILPFGTGVNATTPEKFPSVVFAVAMQDDGGSGGPDTFSPPFTTLKTGGFAGVQRLGTLSLAAQYQDYSIPWRDTDSTLTGISWGETHTSFLALADTMIVTPPPNRWVSQEAADGMRAFGYSGSSPGPFGFIDAHEAPDTFHAVGYQPVSGTLAITEAKDTFSAYIKIPITAALHATEATDQFHAAGIGLGENGTWTSTESVDMVNVTGYTPVSGTFNTTEATDRARFVSGGVVNQRKRRTFYVT